MSHFKDPTTASLFVGWEENKTETQTLLGALSITMKPVVFPADCVCARFKINIIKALLG